MLWNKTRLKNFKEAHRLFQEGKNKTQISKELGIRRQTILEWLKSKLYHGSRGWKRGKGRKYINNNVAKRICQLKQERIGRKRYFVGSPFIQMDYAKTHPRDDLPSIWYVDKVIRNAGLQTRRPKQKKKGGSLYLLYPVECIKKIGHVHQSADFIGKKYIAGRTEPINIFSTSYYAPFSLYQITRILSEKAVYALNVLYKQWRVYPIPDVMRMDNGLQFRGGSRGKRFIGTFLRFIMNLNVTPLFGSPSKPWTNPYVEGHNRVFSEKVWGRNFFTNEAQIDQECERFNQESLELFQFKYSQVIVNENFRYIEKGQHIITDKLETKKSKKIYFIRFVESCEQQNNAYIIILNEKIRLPEKYSHQFVFAEWNIERNHMLIYSEYKKSITLIHQLNFRLNI